MPASKAPEPGKADTLLVELLTEELPPKALATLARAFAGEIESGLARRQLKSASAAQSRVFATPRRLAALVPGVLCAAADRPQETSGPSVKAPQEAVAGFARKHGLEIGQLERRETPKGEVFVARTVAKGAALDAVLAEIVAEAAKKLPVPKVMRWGDGVAEFVRPAHGLVMLHGERVVPGTVLGVESGNETLGHRFLSKGAITVRHADDYEKILAEKGAAIVDFAARRAEISKQLQKAAGGAALVIHDALLDEITAIVEAPAVYAGEFSSDFLAVPEECLVLSMQQHQRYVPLRDRGTGKLLPRFLFVSNIETKEPREIIHGNERVLRARLSDAKFFYEQDRKIPLETRTHQLAGVVYHNKIGTQLERVVCIKKLAATIAETLRADISSTERAAILCKADLLTEMVGEFPELQGVMGRYYALHEGETKEVASAIEEHYRPRFAGDQLPEKLDACALALADKLFAIAGIFAAGQVPTGDRDPFALRRQALGVVRILIEKELNLRLQILVDLAIAHLPNKLHVDWLLVLEFLLDRARTYFLDQGFAKQAIESVIQPFGASTPLFTLPTVVAEASRFISTEDGKILAEANKRITNILKKSGFEVPLGLHPDQLKQKPNSALFKEKAEADFWTALQKIGGESVELRKSQRFAESLRVLSQLGKPTKSFFDDVLVNTEEPDIRDNRITLLQHARAYMNQVAELSLMAQ
jgi:glycyl-tRNA synthetase beta chain